MDRGFSRVPKTAFVEAYHPKFSYLSNFVTVKKGKFFVFVFVFIESIKN